MNFDVGTWWLVAGIAGLAITIITYFLKRTISKVDDHEKDINQIKQSFATKEDLKALAADLKEIKENTLREKDFFRTLSGLERKVDRLYERQYEQTKGGMNDG